MRKHSQLQSEGIGLKRRLNPFHVWAIAFGCIIGWGSFINPGKKFLPVSGVCGTAIAMILGAIMMIVIAFNYAYMVPRYPKAGGEFTFTKVCFGRTMAYLCGWFLVAAYLTNVPMNSTAIGLIVDGLFGPVLKFGFHYSIAGFDVYFGEIILAVSILVLFAFLNICGVQLAGMVQTVLAASLIISVAILVIASILSPKATMVNTMPIWGFDKESALSATKSLTFTKIDQYAHTSLGSIFAAILATLAIAPWAFVGFDTIPQAAEEFKFSYRKVSVIMIVSILFGAFVYISNNTIAAAAVDNWPDLIVNSSRTPWLLLSAAEKLLGVYGKILVGIAVSCAVLSGIMGFYMASSRLMYSMARDHYLPMFFSKLHPKHGTPYKAIIFCLIVSLSGPFLGREALGWFVDMSAIGASIGFGFTCLSTWRTMVVNKERTVFLSTMSFLGAFFSFLFIFLQLFPIPGLASVHFCFESYVMLAIWFLFGITFFIKQRKFFK